MRSNSKLFRILQAALLSLFSVSSLFGQPGQSKALDFDGDNRPDYPVFRPEDNMWMIYGSTGTIRMQQFGIANEDHLVPGDYDGDNRSDIAVWRSTTGYWHVLNSQSFTLTSFKFGDPGDEPVARDYSGDGRTDFAFARRVPNGNTQWWVLYSDWSGHRVENWGRSTDFVVPGDYDGDGLYDYAIQRPGLTPTSGAQFWIYTAKGNIMAEVWGQSNDTAVPGDYDGDGKTDIAVVREGATPEDNLWWYILFSSGQAWWGPLGVSGLDTPVQADYDGDGKTDRAFWRSGEPQGFFVVEKSGSWTYEFVNWGPPNSVPVGGYDNH